MSITRVISLFALTATLAVPLAADAQTTASPMPAPSGSPAPGHHRHHRHHQSLMHTLQSLDLTDAQKQQVHTFQTQERQANQNADAATKRTNAAKMRGQIMGILTPDQKTQLQAKMHQPRMPDGASAAPNVTPSPTPQ